jgi:hypothetical protein
MTVVYREINGQRFYTPIELDSFDYYRDYLLVRNFGELLNANVAEQGSVDANLFGHWKLDSKSGDTLVDDTGNGGDFTLDSGDLADISIISGHDGSAIRNSSADIRLYAAGSIPYNTFTTNFSIVKWNYATDVPVDTGFYNDFYVDEPESGSGFLFRTSSYPSLSDAVIYFYAKTASMDGYISAISSLPVGTSDYTADTWQMISVTVDLEGSPQIRFFLNDSEVSLESGDVYGSGSAIVYNGAFGDHKPYLNYKNPSGGTKFVDEDDIRFYSTTLTPEQIATLYSG